MVWALRYPAVEAAWERPSVLEDQPVSGLVGHLARGAVWAVGDYLDAGEPAGPVTFASAGEYFATVAGRATQDDHRLVRERGAAVASVGREALLATLEARLAALGPRLAGLPGDRLVTVIGGTVMRLDDYLATRIVEQVVHLDDLTRSVGVEAWPLPEESRRLAVEVGVDIARRRHGDGPLIRALYRRGFADGALPVL
ncbi:MAG TPA: maleylpyruvate isomerase N-terminal domain-containing protein [Acidimicrobiales bacterium]|nr:maleylpyruvate isomerase N-terminal domain-containing protein [Acidimicrobiales bacterium]